MSNSFFRQTMPYVVEYQHGIISVKNRDYVELFSCKKRKSKSLIKLLESIAGGEYVNDPVEGFVKTYLYQREPLFSGGAPTGEFLKYLNRYFLLLEYFNLPY